MPLDSAYNEYRPKVDFESGPSPDNLVSTEHVLQPRNDSAIDKSSNSPDWILGVLLLIFGILAWVRVYHIKRLNQLFQAFVYKLYVQTILRSNDSLMGRISFGLNAIFVLVMSLFIYQLVDFHQVVLPYSENVSPFILILIVVFLTYPLKSLILNLIAWLFDDNEKITEYIFNVFLLNKVLGLALVPIVVLVTYLSFGQNVLLNVGVLLIFLNYVNRLFRGFSIGRATANLSQFYIFLYLCTLEILPLVVVARYISSEL